MTFSNRRVLTGAAVLASSCVIALHSQQADSRSRAQAALEQTYAAYKALNAFHAKIKWTAKYSGGMTADDFPVPGPDTIELRMQRPNKFFMATSSKRLGKPSSYLIVSDGTSLWCWRSWTNTYVETKAPAALSEMAKLLPDDAIGTSDGSAWEADSIIEWDLLATNQDPLQGAADAGVVFTLTGPEKLGDAQVNVLRLSAPAGLPFSLETRLYLGVTNHLVRAHGLSARGKHPETGKDFTVEMQAVYEIHNTQPKFTDADFRFVPPPGAKRAVGK